MMTIAYLSFAFIALDSLHTLTIAALNIDRRRGVLSAREGVRDTCLGLGYLLATYMLLSAAENGLMWQAWPLVVTAFLGMLTFAMVGRPKTVITGGTFLGVLFTTIFNVACAGVILAAAIETQGGLS